MSTTLKILISLNNNKLHKELLTKEAGFVNAYTEDIERPYLSHHIFLVYKLKLETTEEINRASYLASVGFIPTIDKIKGSWYSIYTIEMDNVHAIEYKLLTQAVTLNTEDYKQIMDFWKTDEADINDFVFNKNFKKYKFVQSMLNERDEKKSEYEGLTIKKASGKE